MKEGSFSSWTCRIQGLDAKRAGLKNEVKHAIVDIEGMEYVLSAKEDIQSGVTTLLADGATIEDRTLKISREDILTFGTKWEQHSRTLRMSDDIHPGHAVTTVGTKTLLVALVRATDSQPNADRVEISDGVFGTSGDQVNLKTQFEGCSHKKFLIQEATGNGIVDGVIEIQLNIQASGTSKRTLEEESINILEINFNTNDLGELFDHVLLCLPPGTAGGDWLAYAYMGGVVSVYNDDWCGYPSVQLVSYLNFFHDIIFVVSEEKS
jgi:hypothetical protein